MSSTFYSDVSAALQQIADPIEPMINDAMEEHTSNGERSGVVVMATVELLVDEVHDLPPQSNSNLVLCTVICGGHSIRTNMQVPEADCVKFNKRLSVNLPMKRDQEGFYTPEAQYLIIDIYIRYNDKSKADEFIGRVMTPTLYLTPNKQCLEGFGGATPGRDVTNHPRVKYHVTLTSTPSDFVGWTGTQVTPFENMQYKIIVNGNVVDFPGSFETVELYVPGIVSELCDELYQSNVYLTNFRLVVIPLNNEHKRLANWTTFSNILGITKSYVQTGSKKQCCYTVKCADCRTVKIFVPDMSRRQKFKKHIEDTFNVVGKQQGEDKLVMEMKTPPKQEGPKRHTTISAFLSADICSSDGEANEATSVQGISDEDVLGNDLYSNKGGAEGDGVPAERLYNTDVHTLRQVEFPEDGFSEDDMFDLPTFKITDFSDGESVDSLDVSEDQPRTRLFTGTSVSSFTSYLSGYGSSRGSKSSQKSENEPDQKSPKRKIHSHSKKLQMDALRLRIRYHHYNTTLSAPSHSLLKQSSVEKRAGFTRYNLDQEHNRQGDMRGWTKVDNTNYRQCKSYPPLFYVPVQAGPSLVSVIMFRSKGRIPALSWLSNSGAILMRSAQPRTGILQKNCKEDELFLESVQTLSRNKSGKDLPFMIFDARSKIAARGNQMKGKGMENVANYENTKLNFLDMANIHAIRDSFEKVTAMCNAPSNTKWETRLEQSQWLLHVQSVVRGAYFVSQHLVAGGAALVHCSDGWDRTSQLTSLSLLLVDPYYRTYSGFQVLVEREWLSFGHRFHDRLGMAHPSQKSPIFLLFLDAVHQFLVQFPDVFEFTQEYLTVLCDLFSSGWTTTFLRNCPQERSSADRLQLWDVLDAMRTELTNDRYYLSTDPINPRVSLRHMVLWREYFLRFDWWRETLAEDRQGPVVWVPDHAVQNCHLCHERFNALKFKRKHHCRSCGNIFCGNCASKRICIPLKNYTTPVLVCDKCYQEHTTSP